MTATLDAPAPAVTPAVSLPGGPLADLILVRLLPASKSLSPKAIRDSVTPFYIRPPTQEEFGKSLASLRVAGCLPPKGQTLTEAGRRRALAYLGLTDLPAKTNWSTIRDTHLLSKALGVPVDVLKKPAAVAAILLKRKLGLPVGTRNTLSAVFDALACRLLGFPERTKMDLRAALICKRLEASELLTTKQLEQTVPAALLAPKASGRFNPKAAALAGWADAQTAAALPTPVVDETFDLTDFAATVRSVARRCPTGRFGDDLVFISHVWRQLRDEPRFHRLGLDGFKAKLVEANRADLLTLSRADLVQVMNPDDVRESEAAYLNATFHFILIDPE